MDRRIVIVRYRLTARAFRKGLTSSHALDRARAEMLCACGYHQPDPAMQEFIDWNELEIPDLIGSEDDGREGRTIRYRRRNLRVRTVTRATHRSNCEQARRRVRELQAMFCALPMDRFLAGWPVKYRDTQGRTCFARWDGVSDFPDCGQLHVLTHPDNFSREKECAADIPVGDAKLFFYKLSNPEFSEIQFPLTGQITIPLAEAA